MKPVAGHEQYQRLWYQGDETYFDINIEMLDGELSWFQLTLRGKVLSWKSTGTLQTGETEELDVPPPVGYYAASKAIRDGAAVDWAFVESIETMLAQRQDDPILTKLWRVLTQQLPAVQ
ncbi:MAG: hypothetical protein ACFBSG_04005 [Leptolyngbyaceae cyanobacterium]